MQFGLERLEKQLGEITALSMSGPAVRDNYYMGADTILLEGVFGSTDGRAPSKKGMKIMRQVRDDTLKAGPLITDVVLDLFGVPRDAARDDS